MNPDEEKGVIDRILDSLGAYQKDDPYSYAADTNDVEKQLTIEDLLNPERNGPVEINIEAQTSHPNANKAEEARKAWLMYYQTKRETVLQPEERIAMLARCFPVLWDKPWCHPFNAFQLDAWASENRDRLSHGALYAMQFLLWLWGSQRDWKLGKFDLRLAWGHWDADQRVAWKLWASEPYWP